MLTEVNMEYEKVILDLLNRIVALEGRVAELGSRLGRIEPVRKKEVEPAIESQNQRDTTKYLFEGKIYGKRKLVLAVVQSYVKRNPRLRVEELISKFDKSLQGTLGVVRELEDVKRNVTDYQVRFFTGPDEVIKLIDGTCVVCTQWGIGNIGNFIASTKMVYPECVIQETR